MLHNVLLTDYAWADLDIERAILRAAGADLTIAEKQDAASLSNLAADCDAIMTNWAKVPETVIAAAPKCKIIARGWVLAWIISMSLRPRGGESSSPMCPTIASSKWQSMPWL